MSWQLEGKNSGGRLLRNNLFFFSVFFSNDVTHVTSPLFFDMEAWKTAKEAHPGVEWSSYVDKGGILSLADAAALTGDILPVRESYSLFLQRYPLCYGFWKRWAMAEFNQTKYSNGSGVALALLASQGVWEAGSKAASHCVDHWMNWAEFTQTHANDRLWDVLKKGLQRCMLDPKAIGLWKIALAIEKERDPPSEVVALYQSLFSSGAPYVETLWSEFRENGAFKGLLYSDDLESNYKISLMQVAKRSALEAAVSKRHYFHVLPLEASLLQVRKAHHIFTDTPHSARLLTSNTPTPLLF